MAVVTFLLAVIALKSVVIQGDSLSDCLGPLGLAADSKRIHNDQLSASAAYAQQYTAQEARLGNTLAWCAKMDDRPSLTVDLKELKSITGVQTQGFEISDGNIIKQHPTEKFTLAISTTGSKWENLAVSGKQKVFQGSPRVNHIKDNKFPNRVLARYFRIFPQGANNSEVVCLRMEILGCDRVLAPTIDLKGEVIGRLGQKTSLECTVTGQVGSIVTWKDKSGNIVDKNVQRRSEDLELLRKKQVSVLNVNVSAADVLNTKGKYTCQTQDAYLQCETSFTCAAEYSFNKTVTQSKNVKLIYRLEYPKPPSDVDIEKSPGKCIFLFSTTSSGDFPTNKLLYKVATAVGLRRLAFSTTSTSMTGFEAYKEYKVAISVYIEEYDWTSKSLEKSFHSYADVPTVSPVITEIVASGSRELTVKWQKPNYKPSNGVVQKYKITITQVDYGGKKFPIVGLKQIKKDFDNISNAITEYSLDDLKEWSQYSVTIYSYNNDGRTDEKGETKFGKTTMGTPTAAPQNVTITKVGANYIELTWQKPPFILSNGDISHYYASVTESRGNTRRRRSGSLHTIIYKSPHRFLNLEPFRNYKIQIAAANEKGSYGILSEAVGAKTKQAAPSAPENIKCSNDLSRKKWDIIWSHPKQKNGYIRMYELEIISNSKKITDNVIGEITQYSSDVDVTQGLSVQIRARTVEYGPWSEWFVKAAITPTKKPPGKRETGGEGQNQTLLTIMFVLITLVVILVIIIIVAFILYRRRDRMALKVELQMDKILKPPYDNPEAGKDEKERLVRSESLDQNTDNTGSIEDKAHPLIKVEDFYEYVKKMKENEDERFLLEYKHELVSGKRYPWETATRPENKSKNRYANIAAYDHSRVILRPDTTKRKNETDYFNGNTIQGYSPESNTRYIACHGATESVSNDFWRMVWQEDSNVIVMLTKLEEGRKVKCFQYWPTMGSLKFGNVTVKILTTDQTADYFIRTFEITKGNETRTVRQFHFVSWPDHGVPEFPTSLLSLRRRVRHYHKQSAPMIVHCSAGVGRTGCFILIDAMLERIDNDSTVDLFNYLQYMRTRRINMVQTLDQYIFAHDAVLEYILCGNTEISVGDLERRIKELKRGSGMEEEFMILETTSPDPDGLGNIFKVLLRVGRFVDASYVDGYKQRDAFILCRSPSEDFVEDFWTVVREKKVHTIVMLNQLEENPKFHKYWPDLHEYNAVGNTRVLLTSEAKNGNIMSRKIRLLDDAESTEGYEVQHFQFLDWPDHGVPNRRSNLLTLMSLVEKSQQQFGNGPILVHCSNGHGRSGTFAAVYNTTERLKVEQLIDVLQCVRAIRLSVPDAVDNLEQYQFIYNMIRTFLEAFATYSNFMQEQ